MTCLGGLALYSGVFLLMIYDITLAEKVPNWILWYFCLCIFIGQTLDAIDGKHARNTKRGSPLGQLMDHGCDALTNSCHLIFMAQAFTMGTNPSSVLLLQIFLHVSKKQLLFLR